MECRVCAIVALCLLACRVSAGGLVIAERLRCEYRINPLGIDELQPRLSWEMRDDRRGARQSAYRILVASTPEKLAADEGDLWDTGKVLSSETAQIAYGGKPLDSRMQCHWKVRLWDHTGKPSAWSKPALWTMGLLKSEDIKAQWIGYDYVQTPPRPLGTLEDCQWVWFPEGNPRESAPFGKRYFRGKCHVSEDKRISEARLVILADDCSEVCINTRVVAYTGSPNTARSIDVGDYLEPGENTFAIMVHNDGGPAGLAGKLVVNYVDGAEQTFRIDGSWKVSDKEWKAGDLPVLERFLDWVQYDTEWKKWIQPSFDDSDWVNAKEFGPVAKEVGVFTIPPRGCPLLRKEFLIDQPVRRAVLYASALGVYRMRLNGQPVGSDRLSPGWTDYHQRVYYNTYDVTELVRQGANAIGGLLGSGWYCGQLSTIEAGAVYGPHPRLFAQLEVELADGSRTTIVTDSSWKGTPGPIVRGEILGGEVYDATREIPNWDRPGLDDSDWQPVQVTEKIGAKFEAFPGLMVQPTGILKPRKMTEPKPGRYVFDMGQNFSGVARLKVRGPRGTQVELRFAERLNPDGTAYTANYRTARSVDKYTLRGEGEEVFEPEFTHHGFQYVEVRYYPGKPTLESITGVAVNAPIPATGTFDCSNPMLNRLFSNIQWNHRGWSISVPSDTQRDERCGYLGDTEFMVRTECYNADMAAFFTKWFADIRDAQFPEGAFSNIAPRHYDQLRGTASYGDGGVICPWTMYCFYDDRRALEKHYPAMCRWVDYCLANSSGFLRPDGGALFGDWLAPDRGTPRDVLATAYFGYSTNLVAQAARVLGREDDAAKYGELFDKIRTAFNNAYVAEDGRIKGNTQTCYVLALAFDLLPPEKRLQAASHLADDIRARGTRLSTGFCGTSKLMPTLSRFGQTPLAYELVQSEKFPSWGFMVKHGATSIWERWDSWTPDGGFQNPSMNCFSVIPFGAVGEWFYSTMGGIDMAEPGFRKIVIRPEPGGGIKWVKADYGSIRGKIVSNWKQEDGKLLLDVTIPANTTATVYLPMKAGLDASKITESGKPLGRAQGVKVVPSGDHSTVVEVVSGRYHFEIPGE